MFPRTERARRKSVVVWVVLLAMAATAQAEDLMSLLDCHTANKRQVLEQLQRMSPLALKRQFGTDLRDAWQRLFIDGSYAGADKFYLTLAELHPADLQDNRGFIADARPLRLPNWK